MLIVKENRRFKTLKPTIDRGKAETTYTTEKDTEVRTE